MKKFVSKHLYLGLLAFSCITGSQSISAEEFIINDELRKQAHILTISYYNTCFFSSFSTNIQKLQQQNIELTDENINQLIALDHSCAGILDMLLHIHTQSTLTEVQQKLWDTISHSQEYRAFISQDQNKEQLFLMLKNKIDTVTKEALKKSAIAEHQKEIALFSALLAPAKISLMMQEQHTATKKSSAPIPKKSNSPFDALAVPQGGAISKNRDRIPVPNDLFQQTKN